MTKHFSYHYNSKWSSQRPELSNKLKFPIEHKTNDEEQRHRQTKLHVFFRLSLSCKVIGFIALWHLIYKNVTHLSLGHVGGTHTFKSRMHKRKSAPKLINRNNRMISISATSGTWYLWRSFSRLELRSTHNCNKVIDIRGFCISSKWKIYHCSKSLYDVVTMLLSHIPLSLFNRSNTSWYKTSQ